MLVQTSFCVRCSHLNTMVCVTCRLCNMFCRQAWKQAHRPIQLLVALSVRRDMELDVQLRKWLVSFFLFLGGKMVMYSIITDIGVCVYRLMKLLTGIVLWPRCWVHLGRSRILFALLLVKEYNLCVD